MMREGGRLTGGWGGVTIPMTRRSADISAEYLQVARTVVARTSRHVAAALSFRRVITATRQADMVVRGLSSGCRRISPDQLGWVRRRPATHPKIHNRSAVSADIWPAYYDAHR